MAISLNTNNYEQACEYINSTSSYVEAALTKLNMIEARLDARIYEKIKRPLNNIIEDIESIKVTSSKTVSLLVDKAESYKSIEEQASASADKLIATYNTNEESEKVLSQVTNQNQESGATVATKTEKKSGVLGFLEGIWNGIKKVGASIVNFTVSLVKGLFKFVEAIIDAAVMIVTAAASIFTGLYDGFQWIRGMITGQEWTSVTKSMWEGVMNFVGTKWVDKGFSWFYSETGVGKWLDDNAFKWFKSDGIACKIGEGVGYVAGIVLLTIATYGVGGVATGAGSAAGSAASSAAGSAAGGVAGSLAGITGGELALTAGIAGFGKGAQDARAEGASVGQSLLFGVGTGALEAGEFYLGNKIFVGSGEMASSLLKGSGSALQTELLSSGIRIAGNSAIAAGDALARPALSTIYKDGYYDEDGNYIEFTQADGFTDRYKAIFTENGGWSTVAKQAAVTGALTTVGETIRINSYLKDQGYKHGIASKVKETITNTADKLKEGNLDTTTTAAATAAAGKASGLKGKLSELKSTITEKIKNTKAGAMVSKAKTTISEKISGLKESIKSTKVGKVVTAAKSKVKDAVDNFSEWRAKTRASFEETGVGQTIKNVKTYIKDKISSVKEKVSNTKVANVAKSVRSKVRDVWEKYGDWRAGNREKLSNTALGKKINAFKNWRAGNREKLSNSALGQKINAYKNWRAGNRARVKEFFKGSTTETPST